MKKLILAFCLLGGGIVAVSAQDTTSTDKQEQAQYPTQGAQGEQDDRERINSRDLPDAVKRSLEGQEYRGWLINSAYKTKGLSNQDPNLPTPPIDPTDTTGVMKPETGAMATEIYVIELKNGAQTKTVRFDKDGKKLDDPQDDDQDNK